VNQYDQDYWLDTDIDKCQDGCLSEALQEWAHSGQSMSHFMLRKAHLQHLDLVCRNTLTGYDLTHADLYRADLSFSHLFNVNLTGASLMKANLDGANLHCANLTNCNLLGVNFKTTKIAHVNWGKELLQEQQAKQAYKERNQPLYLDYLQQAEEICRSIRISAEHQGLHREAGHFFHREMVVRRKQLPLLSLSRLTSKAADVICGYGEHTGKVIGFALMMIVACSVLFGFTGIYDNGQFVTFDSQLSVWENIKHWGNCLYFSVVTFTTLGYGDLVPSHAARMIAAIEAFTGSFTMAVFVVVFVQKMTR